MGYVYWEPRRERWYLAYSGADGLSHRTATEIREHTKKGKQEAIKRLGDIENEQYRKKALGLEDRVELTFRQLAGRYLKSCRSTKGKKTVERAREVITRFRLFKVDGGREIAALKVQHIKTRHVQAFLDARASKEMKRLDGSKKRVAPGTVERERIALSSIFTWAVKQEYLSGDDHPVKKAEVANHESKKERILTPVEEGQLLSNCRQRPRLAYLESIIRTALVTGMREGELLSLKWGAVDLTVQDIEGARSFGTITVESTNDNPTKSRKTRHIPIAEDLHAMLTVMRDTVMESEQATPAAIRDRYVFVNPKTGTRWVDTKTAWRSLLKKAGVVGLRFHDLRHTFATRFRQNGGDLEILQEILGHADIKTTLRYRHVGNSEKIRAMARMAGTVQRQGTATSAAVGK
jgi:integrase